MDVYTRITNLNIFLLKIKFFIMDIYLEMLAEIGIVTSEQPSTPIKLEYKEKCNECSTLMEEFNNNEWGCPYCGLMSRMPVLSVNEMEYHQVILKF